jgi:c-di-GMP-binding flagellar brake protein YcgR
MEEQRKYIRLPDSLIIGYRVVNSFLRSSSRSKDISEGGVCLSSFQRFDRGVVLELKIQLPEFIEPIIVVGEVKWLRETGDAQLPFLLGVKFIKIDPRERDKLCEHIHRVSQDKKEEKNNIEWGA